MRSITGVVHAAAHIPTKRDVLLFDQLAIIGVEHLLRRVDPVIRKPLLELAARDVIINVGFPTSTTDQIAGLTRQEVASAVADAAVAMTFYTNLQTPAFRTFVPDSVLLAEMIDALEMGPGVDSRAAADAAARRVSELYASGLSVEDAFTRADVLANERLARYISQHLRAVHDRDFIPLSGQDLPADLSATAVPPAAVVRVVLANIPEPAESTTWEALLEFRADPDAQSARRRLVRWMSKIASEKQSLPEIRDEVESLLDAYREYMRIHRIKNTRGRLETVLVLTAEAIEGLLKLQLSRAVKALFDVKRFDAELLEAERTAPGRELAYIVKAETRFGSGA